MVSGSMLPLGVMTPRLKTPPPVLLPAVGAGAVDDPHPASTNPTAAAAAMAAVVFLNMGDVNTSVTKTLLSQSD